MDGPKYCFKSVTMDLKDLCEGLKPNNSGEYIVPTCPVCRDELGIEENHKLYIKSDFTKGYCQRCKSKFFNKSEPKESFIEEYKVPIFGDESEDFELDVVDCEYYTMSKDYIKECIDYLSNRNPKLKDDYTKLKFKFRTNKVVMPCFWNDQVIYYQVRNCETVKSMRSFYLPSSKYKPLWFNPMNSIENTSYCICEGIFGAIGAWYKFEGKINTCACFGSNLTRYQIWMLNQKYFEDLYLYFDDIELNNHNKQIIKSRINRPMTIYSIKSALGDPEDDFVKNQSVSEMRYF